MVARAIRYLGLVGVAAVLLTSCTHKYANPIAKQTDQPDKVLFDKAIDELAHNKFIESRMLLTTLINTYPDSEYLAKAKLALADGWYQEGDAHAMAQAEQEYKDFILFYPTMEESAEAQTKICDIHYNQMEKSDRDTMEARRAEDECRTVLQQYPNSKAAPEVEQKLRNIQEVLADHEYGVGQFYQKKGDFFAGANRLQTLVDNYPLYSQADEALWMASLDYRHLGDKWERQEVMNLTKLVKEYPLSDHVDDAKERLQELKTPVPEMDQAAYDRMKFELANRGKVGIMGKVFGEFSGRPNNVSAARSGAPQMTAMKPTIPANVPARAAGVLGTSGDITASVATDANALDTKPDARTADTAAAGATGADSQQGSVTATTASSVERDALAKSSQNPNGQKSNDKKQKTAKVSKAKEPKPSKKNDKKAKPADAGALPKPDLPSDSPPAKP
ncbi:MAG TPA: outer membrane protein assembly factor BamD [Bryobacteraceae bacterium]|nr:outer membrane protein assembly factor BamD [Bryobacteraceae bacterium]